MRKEISMENNHRIRNDFFSLSYSIQFQFFNFHGLIFTSVRENSARWVKRKRRKASERGNVGAYEMLSQNSQIEKNVKEI